MKIIIKLTALLLFIGSLYFYTNFLSLNPFRNIKYPVQIGFPWVYSWRACSEMQAYGCRNFFDRKKQALNQLVFMVSTITGIVLIYVFSYRKK